MVRYRSPHALALGIACGVCFGLVPITVMYHAILVIVTVLMRVNYLIFLITAAATMGVATQLFGLADTIGHAVLSSPLLQGLFMMLAKYPITFVFLWNNTTIMGGYMMALFMGLPVYGIALYSMRKIRHRVRRRSH
jgi:uncharacterized protein (TIGR03546 family)